MTFKIEKGDLASTKSGSLQHAKTRGWEFISKSFSNVPGDSGVHWSGLEVNKLIKVASVVGRNSEPSSLLFNQSSSNVPGFYIRVPGEPLLEKQVSSAVRHSL